MRAGRLISLTLPLLVDRDGLLLADAGGFREGSHDTALGGRDNFFLRHVFDPFVDPRRTIPWWVCA